MLCLPPERDARVRMDSVGGRFTFNCKLFDILNLFTCMLPISKKNHVCLFFFGHTTWHMGMGS